jgi:hypothetical protein
MTEPRRRTIRSVRDWVLSAEILFDRRERLRHRRLYAWPEDPAAPAVRELFHQGVTARTGGVPTRAYCGTTYTLTVVPVAKVRAPRRVGATIRASRRSRSCPQRGTSPGPRGERGRSGQ